MVSFLTDLLAYDLVIPRSRWW